MKYLVLTGATPEEIEIIESETARDAFWKKNILLNANQDGFWEGHDSFSIEKDSWNILDAESLLKNNQLKKKKQKRKKKKKLK